MKKQIIQYNFLKNTNLQEKNNLPVSFNNHSFVSIYSDDLWDFSYENQTNKATLKSMTLKFNDFDSYPLLKESLKECAYKLLTFGIKSTSLFNKILSIKNFYYYIIENFKVYDLKKLSIEHINSYINYISNNSFSYSTCKNKLLFLNNLLFKYRNEFTHSINFQPFQGKKLSSILNKKPNIKEINQTDIIPDLKWKEIICLCNSYIDKYNKNIDIENLLHNFWIEEYNSKKNGNHKDKTLNFRKTFIYKKFNSHTNGIEEYQNITNYSYFIKDVITACGIIIQAFTGMRKSELLSLEKNCCVNFNSIINGVECNLKKINGLTFKYQKTIEDNHQIGQKADWLCPQIVFDAVNVLESIHQTSYYIFKEKNITPYLFTSIYLNNFNDSSVLNCTLLYDEFIKKNGIKLDFKLTSHCFRRTLARFFARNLLDLPVDVLKEQFKHFSKDITLYYMKEDLKNEDSFSELINNFITADSKNVLFEKLDSKFNNSILTAKNVDDIKLFVGNKQVSLINEFMSSIIQKEQISPLKSLTCEGTIILPDIHLDYWTEMLILYKELIDLEPNSIWYKYEYNLINEVVNKLKNGNAYIVGDNKND